MRSIVAAAQVSPAGVVSLSGQLTLGQLGAAIALAAVVVANNSGPAHISAALGTPLVDLYAQTNPQHTPWLVAHRVLFHDVPCRNCFRSVCPEGHHDCLVKVAPERVAAAVCELIEESMRGGRHSIEA
ncbi:MAG: glycosyl transferase [Massilia sp.]|nr:glycosyl transferase [Massilia sp.]